MNTRLANILCLLLLCGCAQTQLGRRQATLSGADPAAVRGAMLDVLRTRFPEDLRQEPDGRLHGLGPDRTPEDAPRPHRRAHADAWVEAWTGGALVHVRVIHLRAHGGTPFLYTGPRDPHWRVEGRDEAAEDAIIEAVRQELARERTAP